MVGGGLDYHIACMFVCLGGLRGRALVAFMGVWKFGNSLCYGVGGGFASV